MIRAIRTGHRAKFCQSSKSASGKNEVVFSNCRQALNMTIVQHTIMSTASHSFPGQEEVTRQQVQEINRRCRSGFRSGIRQTPHQEQAPHPMGRERWPTSPSRRQSTGWTAPRGKRSALRTDGGRRHLHQAQPEALARLLLRALRPERRGPRRRPHLHLLALEGRRGPDQQLGGSLRDAPQAEGALQRLHARPHHVRAALQHGPDRLADVADRRATHRFGLRGGEHAHHGPHRHAGLQGNRQGLQARRALHAFGRRAARARAEGCPLALQSTTKYIVHFPRNARDLVLRLRLRRQRPARQKMLRPAHRLQHGARRGLDGRAHAHPRRRRSRKAKRPTWPRPSRAPAAKPISPC